MERSQGRASWLVEGAQQMIQWRFFSRHEPTPGSWQIVAWWEARRIPYNLMVGATGIVTVALCLVTARCERFLGQPIWLPGSPMLAIFAVPVYGLMANVCFTGGWVAEIVIAKVWPGESTAFGQISFCLGLVFSLLLTLLPGVLIVVVGALSLLRHALGN
jgi:hypothetical protein